MHYKELGAAWQELPAPNAPFETQTMQARGAPVRVFSQAPRTVRELWLSNGKFMKRQVRDPLIAERSSNGSTR